MRYSVAIVAAFVLAGAAACSRNDATTPIVDATGGLRIVQGANGRDTVQSRMSSPLVVEVHDPATGQAVPNAIVIFDAGYVPGIRSSVPVAMPYLPDRLFPSSRAGIDSVRTDARGRVTMGVLLGVRAGTAEIRISTSAIPDARVTATYTILAGKPASLIVTPGDTAVYAGKQYLLQASAADIWSNPTLGTATIAALTPTIATVSSSGLVQARAIGRASFLVTAAGNDTTVFLSVPPVGTLLGIENLGRSYFGLETGPYRVVRSAIDGSDRRELMSASDLNQGGLAATADGTTLIAAFGGISLTATRLSASVAPVPFLSVSNPFVSITNPVYSPDNNYVYFSGRTASSGYGMWRSRSDGTQYERVGPSTPTSAPTGDVGADVSPSGRFVAYWTRRADGLNVIRILDLTTGSVSTQDEQGMTPRWLTEDTLVYIAPDAYGASAIVDTATGRLALIRFSEGRIRAEDFLFHVVTPAWRNGFAVSPDRKYLLVRSGDGVIEVVDRTTRERIPLPFTKSVLQAVWRP